MLPVAAARHDFAVHFDGDAALAVAGVSKQARNGGRLRAFMWLAIEIDVHARSLAPCVGQWRLWQAGPATAVPVPEPANGNPHVLSSHAAAITNGSRIADRCSEAGACAAARDVRALGGCEVAVCCVAAHAVFPVGAFAAGAAFP